MTRNKVENRPNKEGKVEIKKLIRSILNIQKRYNSENREAGEITIDFIRESLLEITKYNQDLVSSSSRKSREEQTMIANSIRSAYKPNLISIMPLYLVDIEHLSHSFDKGSLFDWKAKTIFNPRLDIECIECIDPYSRQLIRAANKDYFKAKSILSDITEELREIIVDHLKSPSEESLDLVLYFLELGIVDPSLFPFIIEMLHNIEIYGEERKNIDFEDENDHLEGQSKMNRAPTIGFAKESETGSEMDDDQHEILGVQSDKQSDSLTKKTIGAINKIAEKTQELKGFRYKIPIYTKIASITLHLIIARADDSLIFSTLDYFNDKEFTHQMMGIIMRILRGIDILDRVLGDKLWFIIDRIFMCFLNIRNDPFVLSMHPKSNIEYYTVSLNAIQKFSQEISKLSDRITEVIKGSSTTITQLRTENALLDDVEKCMKILINSITTEDTHYQKGLDFNEDKNTPENRVNILSPSRLALTFTPIINLLLFYVEVYVASDVDIKYTKVVLDLLALIIQDNPCAQSQLFSSPGRLLIQTLMDFPIEPLDIETSSEVDKRLISKRSIYLFYCMIFLRDCFMNDSSVVFKNQRNWRFLFNVLTARIEEYIDLDDNSIDNSPKYWQLIYLINDLFFSLLNKNVDNEEERAFDAAIQHFYIDIINKKVIPYFKGNNFDDQSHYKPIMISLNHWDKSKVMEKLNKMGGPEIHEYLKMDAYLSFLKLFNESSEVWRYFVPGSDIKGIFDLIAYSPIKKSDIREDSGLEDHESNPEIATDLIFRMKNVKYRYNFYKEFLQLYTNLEIFELSSLQSLTAENSILTKQLKVNIGHMILVIDSIRNFNISTDKEINRAKEEFVLYGILRSCYKIISGINLVYNPDKYNDLEIYSLHTALKNQLKNILEALNLKGSEMQEITDLFPSVSDPSKRTSSPDRSAKKRMTYGMSKHTTKNEGSSEILIDLLECIARIFEIKGARDEIEQFSRETIGELQSKQTKAFSQMKYHGSIGLEKFLLRVYKEKDKNDATLQVNNDTEEIKHINFFKERDSDSLGSLSEKFNEYITNKRRFLRNRKNSFFQFMDEGDQSEDGDLYYSLLCSWIVIGFSKNRVANGIKVISSNAEIGVNNAILQDTYLFAWITNLDNILLLKPQVRSIFFGQFFEADLSKLIGKSNANIFDEENEPLQEEIESSGDYFDYGQYFLKIIFNTALFFQNSIRKEVFSRSFLMNHQYYIAISSMIKSLAENNFQPFKEYVGYLVIPMSGSSEDAQILTSNRNKTNFLEDYFNGIYINPRLQVKKKVYTRDDRPDLNWFNIITLETISEYFNGPCRRNQNEYIKQLDDLLQLLQKVNNDTESTFYELQSAIVNFILVLIEGNNPKKCKIIGESISPGSFYSNIINHLRLLYESKYQSKHNSESEKLNPRKISKHLIEVYKIQDDFHKHTILNIAISMFFIMKSVSTKSKKYQRFLETKTIEMARQFGEEGLEINAGLKEQIRLKKFEEMQEKDKSAKNKTNAELPLDQAITTNKIEQSEAAFKSTLGLIGKTFKGETKISPEQIGLVYFYFINRISLSVEIVAADRTPVLVYFPMNPQCMFLTKTTRESFQQECNIDDTASKVLDLMNHKGEFKSEMESNMSIYRESIPISKVTSEDSFYGVLYITWSIGLIINILVIFGYGYNESDLWTIDDIPKYIIYFLYAILCLISVIMLLLWTKYKYKESRTIAREFIRRKNKDIESNGMMIWLQINIYRSVIKEPIPVMLFLHVAFTAAAFLQDPIFHTFHLFLLIFLSKTARYVIKSVTEHYKQLALTFILAVFATYFYAMINAMYFRNLFDEQASGGYDLCQSMLSCFMYVLDMGLRNGGGIADSHNALPITDGSRFYLKLIFNQSFFIFINLVSLNIIFGVIIDTFAELRDEQQARGTC